MASITLNTANSTIAITVTGNLTLDAPANTGIIVATATSLTSGNTTVLGTLVNQPAGGYSITGVVPAVSSYNVVVMASETLTVTANTIVG